VIYHAVLILSAVCFFVMIIGVGLPTKADFSLEGAIRAFWVAAIIVVVYWGLNNGGNGALATLLCGFVAGLWGANKAAERTIAQLQYQVQHPPDSVASAAVDMLVAATREALAAVAEIRTKSLEGER
jgi:hypothetical protein